MGDALSFLQKVSACDAESLVRDVDFPAMQAGPLFRLLFDLDAAKQSEQREEIISWYIDGLQQAISNEGGCFRQIHNSEGRPISFCGWTVDRQQQKELGMGIQTQQTDRLEKQCPQALNVATWCQLSSSLRTEKKRVSGALRVVHRR